MQAKCSVMFCLAEMVCLAGERGRAKTSPRASGGWPREKRGRGRGPVSARAECGRERENERETEGEGEGEGEAEGDRERVGHLSSRGWRVSGGTEGSSRVNSRVMSPPILQTPDRI